MKSNALLKVIVPVILAVVIFAVLKTGGKTTTNSPIDSNLKLSKEEAKALGIEGDTAKDTLATLLGKIKETQKDVSDVKKQNADLKTENERLKEREKNVDGLISKAVNEATANAQQQIQAVQEEANKNFNNKTKGFMDRLNLLQDKLGDLTNQQQNQLPIGGSDPSSATVWIEPTDAQLIDPRASQKNTGFAFPNSFNKTATETQGQFKDGLDQAKKPLEIKKVHYSDQNRYKDQKPVYTLAENSTLMGSLAMTALIGRVPVAGSVSDPYPFKILIGRDNLLANGFDLPEVTGAVASGTATGDWTLSCVRGQVDSLTFIFADGTVRTVPEPEKVTRSNSNSVGNSGSNTTTTNFKGGLGYISDPIGIPCISGERKSNAKEYIGTQALITVAGAGLASALSKDDKGSNGGYFNSGSNNSVSDRNGALNSILSGGVEDVRNWINKLYGEAFAAVYVPPHAEIAVHISKEIMIDYEPNGRKVRHNAQNTQNTILD